MCSADNDTIPDGIKYHFADIYLDEIEKVGAEEVTLSIILMLYIIVGFISLIDEHLVNV